MRSGGGESKRLRDCSAVLGGWRVGGGRAAEREEKAECQHVQTSEAFSQESLLLFRGSWNCVAISGVSLMSRCVCFTRGVVLQARATRETGSRGSRAGARPSCLSTHTLQQSPCRLQHVPVYTVCTGGVVLSACVCVYEESCTEHMCMRVYQESGTEPMAACAPG